MKGMNQLLAGHSSSAEERRLELIALESPPTILEASVGLKTDTKALPPPFSWRKRHSVTQQDPRHSTMTVAVSTECKWL